MQGSRHETRISTRSHATPRISHAEKEITCPAHEQLVNRRGNTLCRVHSSLDSQSYSELNATYEPIRN